MQPVLRNILQLKQAGLLSGPKALLESACRSTGEALDRYVNQSWAAQAGAVRSASAQVHLQEDEHEATQQQPRWPAPPSGRGPQALEAVATIDPGYAEHPDVMLRSMTNEAAGPSGRHYPEQRGNGRQTPGNAAEIPRTSGQLSTLVRQLNKDRRLRDLIRVVDAFLLQNTDMGPSGRGAQLRPGLAINVSTWHAYVTSLVGLKGSTEKMLRALELLKSQSHREEVDQERAKIYSIVLQRLNMEAGSCDSRDRAAWCAKRAAAIIASLEANPEGWPGTPYDQISHYGYAIMACLGGKEHGPASRLMQTAERLAEEEPWDVALGSRIYSGIMLMHVQGRRTGLAHHYLRKANAAGIYITAASLQLAASYAAEMDDIDLLLTIMQCITRMQDQAPIASSKINLDEGTLLAIITQAAGNGAVELAEVTWQVMMASITADLQPVSSTATLTAEQQERHAKTRQSLTVPLPIAYHGLIHTYAKAGDFRSAFRTLAQLEAAYPERPQLVAWTPALAMLVDACAASIETADDAFYALESMHQQGETVSTPMVNCIVAACAQIGDLSRTFETFDALQTLGLSPDTNSYNAALLCCMCSDSLASAPKVLEELEQSKHLQHNALTHYLIVRYHLARRELPAAVSALYFMRNSGIMPSLELCDQVLLRCQRAGYYEGQQQMTKGQDPIIPHYVTTGRPRKAPIDVMGSGMRPAPTGGPEARATSATPFGPRLPAAQQAARVAASSRGYENRQSQQQQQQQQQDQAAAESVWDS